MDNEHLPEQDAASQPQSHDQRADYDAQRRRCPVAHNSTGGWSLYEHADVLRALLDHDTFSNAVSQHLSVPNGMDPPEHTPYRRLIEKYFTPERMQTFEPVCRKIAQGLVNDLVQRGQVEFMSEVASRFGVAVQCAFLGWPDTLQGTLLRWLRRNRDATLAQDRKALSEIAREFEAIIDDLLEKRRAAGSGPDVDITASLMHEEVWQRPLSNEELSSILRNWTAGEIGTISAAVGIIAEFLARRQDVQDRLRRERHLLPAAIDEILRIRGPLVSNRRITRRPVEIGNQQIGKGERITLNWVSANRDEKVFGNPDEFRLGRDPAKNLLYGAGIHVCPGAPLASLEMRAFLEELLNSTERIQLVADEPATLASYPASGFATLPLRFH
ncbi:MAG TPA: cytochrome P450 [Verrucomicrobiae bacterium]|nr:cytochrome P450 [Verrucomicrobiae bacterium]